MRAIDFGWFSFYRFNPEYQYGWVIHVQVWRFVFSFGWTSR